MTVLQRRFSTAVPTPHWRPRHRLQRLLDQAGPLLRRPGFVLAMALLLFTLLAALLPGLFTSVDPYATQPAAKLLPPSATHSIDRKSYASTVYNAAFPVVDGVYDVTTPYFRSQGDKLAFDPQGAAALLDGAGWALGADNYRYKNGKRLTLQYSVAGKENAGDVLIQDQLRKVGIEVKLKIQTIAEWAAGNAAGTYDLTYTYMTRADPIVLQTILDPRSANSSTLATNTYEPSVLPLAQGLFDAGLTATSTQQRADAYGQLQDLLIEQGSAIPVYERVWQAATSSRVHNFRWSAEGFAFLNDIEIKP